MMGTLVKGASSLSAGAKYLNVAFLQYDVTPLCIRNTI